MSRSPLECSVGLALYNMPHRLHLQATHSCKKTNSKLGTRLQDHELKGQGSNY